MTLGGLPGSWKTKKQTIISRSSAKAEYWPMATVATSELIWLKYLLVSLRVLPDQHMIFFCDSQAVMHIVRNPVFHWKTKHIEIDRHFVCERLLTRDLVFIISIF